MSKSLLTGRFKWLDLAKFNLKKYDNDRLRCYGLEVDLEYPKEFYELHTAVIPDLQIKKEIKNEMLSGYQ